MLILTIVIGGYSATAQAFGPVFSDHGQVQMMDTGCAGCPYEASGHEQDQDGSTPKCCDMNCHHCCAGHMGFLPATAINFTQFSNVLTAIYVENIANEFTFSLLRPPRNLV